MWKEFKHDLSHPREAFIRSWYGVKGKNPLVPQEVRFLAFAMCFVGLAQLIVGIVLILVGLGLV